jgi:hypothetical protein
MYDTKPCEPNPTLSGPNLTAFEGQGRNHVPRCVSTGPVVARLAVMANFKRERQNLSGTPNSAGGPMGGTATRKKLAVTAL